MNVKDNDLEYIVPSGSASVNEIRMIVKSRDVFLCHTGVDKEAFVLPFAAELRRHAISYWLDEAEIHWGESIPGKVNDGLAEARFVVVFITEAFVNRPFPTAELMSSLNVELTAGKTRVLLIVAIARSEFLRHYPLLADKRYLDWESGTKRTALALLQTLGRRYQSEWTWIYPQDHLGQVWFRVAPNPESQNEKHRCSISWGPWNYELS